MMDVYVAEAAGGGLNAYVVMVDGKVYDTFTSSKRLSWSQMDDVARGYREALDADG